MQASRRFSVHFGPATFTVRANERRETAARVSALVLANIFQEQLALTDTRIDTLRKVEKSKDMIRGTAKHWRWIWENINYVPIFQLGERVLVELPGSQNTTVAVKALLAEAQAICQKQAALRHDLMGRIYTDLSEILFIARKREKEKAGSTIYVNLWRNPRSIHEALDLATRIADQKAPVDVTGMGFTNIPSPSGKLGEIVSVPAASGEDNWSGALFAQTELFRQRG